MHSHGTSQSVHHSGPSSLNTEDDRTASATEHKKGKVSKQRREISNERSSHDATMFPSPKRSQPQGFDHEDGLEVEVERRRLNDPSRIFSKDSKPFTIGTWIRQWFSEG
ncbi:hypothetical protein sscle_04g040210 [Sclerotinia sclerotiorum 1980 UF-70]|uniref:Uncharacterized protein n=1 Tax=Sclerotinia sclerotiorum (strain ATCC 18683 / 1980 / Ss-1) TaxID=665079 RepID=A0A1D9Q2S9_SCLS1|nr:hypothetical protein sscle_04g040210 [Sclerotinia sclerotiorum 1980 UF-70]